jgi:hypothetical protein
MIRSDLFSSRPETREELAAWTEEFFGFKPTMEKVCDHHNSQMDYLEWSTQAMGDCFVVACRNFGKTRLGGVAMIYDAKFRPPCSTIIVGGCIHPQTPMLTDHGFAPAFMLSEGDTIFTGKQWSQIKSRGFSSGKKAIELSIKSLGRFILSADHPVIIVEGVHCRLSRSNKSHSDFKVCDLGYGCPFNIGCQHLRCRGFSSIREKRADEIRVGDALLFPLNYFESGSSDKVPKLPAFLLGILFGSRKKTIDGEVRFFRRYSRSREIDLFSLNSLRDAVGRHLGFVPWRQYSAGRSFVIAYDRNLFEGIGLSDRLPAGIYSWPIEERRAFLKGALSGTLCSFAQSSTDIQPFRTARNSEFALNLYSLLAEHPPSIDSDKEREARLGFSSRASRLHRVLPKRIVLSEQKYKESVTRVSSSFGRALALRVSGIKETIPDVPFIDFEIGIEPFFQTLFGLVHNSERQSIKMYKYVKPLLKSRMMEEELLGPPQREITELVNGSSLEIIPSTELAAQGFHQRRIRIDEIDDIKRPVWDTVQYDIDTAEVLDCQVEGFGTYHRPGGVYEEVLLKARAKGIKIFRACILEAIEPCKGRLCSNCDLSDICGGIAKDKHEGFMKIDKLIAVRNRVLSPQDWRVKMLLEEPRVLDAIIPDFQDKAPFIRKIAYSRGLPTYRFFDWGATGNFFCIWAQINEFSRPRVHILDEHTEPRGVAPSRCAKNVLMHETAKGYSNIIASYGDPSGTSWITEFNLYGIYPIVLVFRKQARLNVLLRLLALVNGEPDIIIDPQCKILRQQLRAYDVRAFHNMKGGPQDDGVDALLYGISSLHLRLRLKDDQPVGTVSMSSATQMNAKFDPALQEVLNIQKGKVDFNELIP